MNPRGKEEEKVNDALSIACAEMYGEEYTEPESTIPKYSFFDYVDRMIDLYVTYRQRYVLMEKSGSVYMPHTKQSKGDPVPLKLSNNVVCAHLNRKLAVSVFAGQYSSKFMCFDVDDGNPSTVHKIIDALESYGIPRGYIYVSTSGGKGYHVELFFDRLVYTEDQRIMFDYLCMTNDIKGDKVEFRPTFKQSIKLPLSIHYRTGNICWYLDRDTLEPICDESYIMTIKQYSGDAFTDIVKSLPWKSPLPLPEELNPDIERVVKKNIDHNDLIRIEEGCYPDLTESGHTHNTMLSIAVYCRCNRMDEEEIRSELVRWLARQNPDYITDSEQATARDIENIISWVTKPTFRLPSQTTKPVTFLKHDIETVLAQPTKTDRKIVFLIQYFEKKYGWMVMSYERMAACVGCASLTTKRNVEKLVNMNVIVKKNGKVKVNPSTGEIMKGANSYQINRHYATESSIAFLQDSYTIKEHITPDNFMTVYYSMLSQMVTKKDLTKLLTHAEIKEIMEVEKDE